MIDLLATVVFRKKFNVLLGAALQPLQHDVNVGARVLGTQTRHSHPIGPQGGKQALDKILSFGEIK